MLLSHLLPDALDTLLDSVGRRAAEYARAKEQVTPEMAKRAVALSQRAPAAPRGLIVGAVVGGLDDETFDRVSEGVVDGWDWFSDMVAGVRDSPLAQAAGEPVMKQWNYVTKPALRLMMLGGDAMFHGAVGRPLTAGAMAAYDGPGGTTYEQAYEDYGDSAGTNAARELYEAGRDPNRSVMGTLFGDDNADTEADESFLGTGVLPGGQMQQRSDLQRTLTVDGQRASIGTVTPQVRMLGAAGASLRDWENAPSQVRSIGRTMAPGEGVYNFAAGLINFGAEVFLDPMNILLGGSPAAARGVTRLGKTLNISEDSVDDVAEWFSKGSRGRRRETMHLSMADAEEARKAGIGEANSFTREVIALDDPDVYESLARNAGLIDGVRRTALTEKLEPMLLNEKLLDVLADSSPHEIYQSIARSPANHFDADLLLRLGDAKSREEVAEVVVEAIRQGDIADTRVLRGVGRTYGVRFDFTPIDRAMRKSKVLESYRGEAPYGIVHIEDRFGSAGLIDSWGATARLSLDDRAELFERALRAETQDDLFAVATDTVFRADFGDAKPEVIEEARKLFSQAAEEQKGYARGYAQDDAGMEFISSTSDVVSVPTRDGSVDIAMPSPAFMSQLANAGFMMPNPTATRRAVDKLGQMERLTTSKGWELTGDMTRKVTIEYFKPAAILRPAYLARVLPEEMGRMSGAGLGSVFSGNPVEWIIANHLLARNQVDIMGTPMDQRALDWGVITQDATGTLDDIGRIKGTGTKTWDAVVKGPTPAESSSYLRGWRTRLSQMSASPEMRVIARSNGDHDTFLQWAKTTKQGKDWMRRMSQSSPRSKSALSTDEGVKRWVSERHAMILREIGGEADDTLNVLNNGSDALRRGIADGTFSRSQEDLVRLTHDNFSAGPLRTMTPRQATTEQTNKIVDALFEEITSKPTNYFSRIPAFRQSAIRDYTENLDALATDAMRADVAEKMKSGMNLTVPEREALDRAVRLNQGKAGPMTDLEAFNDVIIGRAAREAKDLMYDTSRRGKIQDAHPAALPFFDAWLEVATRWAKLARENKGLFRRAVNGYQSAEDAGAFYVNDQGEKVFNYPSPVLMSQLLMGSAATSGLAVGFEGNGTSLTATGRLEGLNLVASSPGPGFGPALTIPVAASQLLESETMTSLRKFILPYGAEADSPEDLASPDTYLNAVMPPWMTKILNGLSGGQLNQQEHYSATGDALAALSVSRPDLDPGNRDDAQELLKIANRSATYLLMLRGSLQAFLPTGPTLQVEVAEGRPEDPEWDPENDPDAQWFMLNVMRNQYYDILEDNNYDSQLANTEFLMRFGHEPFRLTAAKSREIRERPVTKEGDLWLGERSEDTAKYPDVAGWFVPAEKATGDIDFAVFGRLFAEGNRQALTPEDQLRASTSLAAYAEYRKARDTIDALGYTGQQRSNLMDQAKAQLDERYGKGWDAQGGSAIGQKMAPDDAIRQMEEALEGGAFADSPLRDPLTVYLEVRKRVYDRALEDGYRSLTAEAAQPLRQYLREAGEQIKTQDSTFARVWDELLSREVD